MLFNYIIITPLSPRTGMVFILPAEIDSGTKMNFLSYITSFDQKLTQYSFAIPNTFSIIGSIFATSFGKRISKECLNVDVLIFSLVSMFSP